MDKKEVKKELLELKDRMLKLENRLDELNDDDSKFKKFKPKKGERYYFLNLNGKVTERGNHTQDDVGIIENTFTFKTKEHAEQYRVFMDLIKKSSKPFKIDEHNYGLYYDSTLKKIRTTWTEFALEKILYFDERVAKYLVEKYPNEIKYWYLEMPYEE